MKSNFFKKTVSMALAVTMCSSIACSAGFFTKAAEPEDIDDDIVAAESAEVRGDLTSRANDTFTVNGLIYQKIDEKSVAVVGHKNTVTIVPANDHYTIPAKVSHNKKSYAVTSIGEYAFSSTDRLKKITLPNSIISIGRSAFDSCTNLQEINLPDSLTSIGYFAFSSCKSLQEINIPDSVTLINSLAFAYSGLKSVSIPNSVTSINTRTFYGC